MKAFSRSSPSSVSLVMSFSARYFNRSLFSPSSFLGAFQAYGDDGINFPVDFQCGPLAVITLFGNLTAQENHFLFIAEGARAEFVAHTEVGNHSAAGRSPV